MTNHVHSTRADRPRTLDGRAAASVARRCAYLGALLICAAGLTASAWAAGPLQRLAESEWIVERAATESPAATIGAAAAEDLGKKAKRAADHASARLGGSTEEAGRALVQGVAARQSALATGAAMAAAPQRRIAYPTGLTEVTSTIVPTASVNQTRALAKLAASVSDPTDASIRFSDMGTPSQIEAADLSDPAVRSPVRSLIARGVLDRNRDLLRLADPEREMAIAAETTDAHGIARIRFRQTYQGVPVFAQEASVYVDPDGRATRFAGRYRPTPRIDTVVPALTPAQAQAAATRHAGEELAIVRTDLVILPADDTNDMTLAWHVEGYASAARGWDFFIDAANGALLDRYSAVQHPAVGASGKDLDNKTVAFTAWQESGKYYLVDVTRPGNVAGGVPNANVGNIWIYDCSINADCPTALSTSPNTGWNAAAVSAISAMYSVTSYFLNVHGRKGIDDANATVRAVVNDAQEPSNAFWSASEQAMFFGKGDGVETANLARTDIAGHEMTHGITKQTANLVYKGQSGALNESFSDFFGMMIKNAGWTIGDGAFLKYPYLRNMSDPHQGSPECLKKGFAFAQPKHMDEFVVPDDPPGGDNGGVHCNSGIPNRAFYLIAEGLTAEGLGASIGRQHAEQIYYYALTQLLHQSDQFIDARRALIKAAEIKFGAGSADAKAVARAFDVVGIVEPQAAPAPGTALVPTDGDPINAATWLVYRRGDGRLMADTPTGPVGPLSAYAAAVQRPGIVWSATANNGLVFYVQDQTHSLRAIDLATGADDLVFSGDVYAFAISPNAKQIAFTFYSDTKLFVGDLGTSVVTPYQPRMPNPDGTARDAGIDVYSPAFDYLSENVIFDFKFTLEALGGSTSRLFSFGTLSILTGEFDTVATGQPANQQVLNPVFAANNNYVVAFDLTDSSTPSNSGLYVLNTVARKSRGLVGLDLTGQNRTALGWPVFNRDDSALWYQTRNTVSGTDYYPYRVYSSPLTKAADGAWTPSTSASILTAANGTGHPQLLVRGERGSVVHPSFSTNPTQLQFASIAVGGLAQQSVTLTNTGDVDVTITGITVDIADFRSPSTNRLLPRGKSVTILVDFIPTAAGARTGTLSIKSDAGTKTIALAGTATGQAVTLSTVIEYYNAALDHYFITWVPDEIAKLDAGTVIKGWTRTGKSFNTYRTASAGTSPVCRYYIPPGKGDSHFFGRGTAECNATGQNNPTFVLEDPAFMQMFLPAAGVCPANTVQVYRVFSNRPDANHRYMTDKAVRAQMVGKGWLAEGDGPDMVVMCAPQ